MRLTTKGYYAVMAMLDVALHQTEGPVSLADISRRHKISQSYLEQLFSRLRKKGLVKSIRGPGGGYKIQKALDQLTVAEVILAVHESSPMIFDFCHHRYPEEMDLNSYLWKGLDQVIYRHLKAITYMQLLNQCQDHQVTQDPKMHKKNEKVKETDCVTVE